VPAKLRSASTAALVVKDERKTVPDHEADG
jgi:hypothetical protein